ncbi:restriction endonuclease subunit S [Enterocloster lavalensis]|jgi:type I restriction enzyme S subunit|uniref:restriction endonuclease subunit S n=1 Tax=Enterocloster lavalensis TaxID=460384 RepID=UPI0034A3BFC2
MKAADLRKSILQAAVQGRLVPQDKNDKPASELFKQIQAKKNELIKEGRIKKEKPMLPITDDEIPYDLPEGWVWCRLCDLGSFSSGKTPDMTNPLFWDNGTVIWVSSKDMKSKYLSDSKMKITELAKENMTIYPAGTLLMVVRSGILKRMLPVCVLTVESTVNQDIKAYSLFDLTMSEYVYVMLKGLEKTILDNYTKQVTTVDSLRFEEFSREMPVPLPPVEEQWRIVAKVDELMAMCDELEAAEKELDALESHFFDYLPKSILQAAVQGKLVPQDKNDEPASELLKRIQVEKAKLIKEGKIKKEKSLPPIREDEIPYDLPEGWVWCRTANICSYIQRGKSPVYSDEEKYPVISQKCVQWSGIDIRKARFIEPDTFSKYEDVRKLKTGDLLWNSTGQGTLGRIALYDERINCYECAVADSHVTVLRPLQVLSKYVYYWFAGPDVQSTIEEKATGSTKQIELATSTVLNYIFPLPPLAEQQRIVAKVDELMTLCDELKCVGKQPIDHLNVIPFPAKAELDHTEPIKMAAQGKVVAQPSKQHTEALNDLLGMMDDD